MHLLSNPFGYLILIVLAVLVALVAYRVYRVINPVIGIADELEEYDRNAKGTNIDKNTPLGTVKDALK